MCLGSVSCIDCRLSFQLSRQNGLGPNGEALRIEGLQWPRLVEGMTFSETRRGSCSDMAIPQHLTCKLRKMSRATETLLQG
jgi:hypothetical protein